MKRLIMLVLCMVAIGCTRKPITIELPKPEPIARVEQKPETRQEVPVVDTDTYKLSKYDVWEVKHVKKHKRTPKPYTLVKVSSSTGMILVEEPVKPNYKWLYYTLIIAILCVIMFIISIVFKL